MKLACSNVEQLESGRACKSWSKWRKTPAPTTSSVSLVAKRSSPKRLSDMRVLCPLLLPVSPLMLEWSWKHERDPEGGKLARRGEASFIGQGGGMVQWQAERKERVRDLGGQLTSHPHGGTGDTLHMSTSALMRPPAPHSQSNVNLISQRLKASNSPNYSSSFYGLQHGSDGEMSEAPL